MSSRPGQCRRPPPAVEPCQVYALLATSDAGLKQNVNGIYAPHLASSGDIWCGGDLTVTGKIYGNGQSASGTFGLNDGSLLTPSLYFLNETELGLYRPADGVLAFTDGVVPIATASAATFSVNQEISTEGGNDLSIRPGGPNVDFNGKNLINIGAIITNPNYFQIVSAAPVTTPDATPTSIASFTTDTDCVYTIRADISGISLVDSTSAASISLFASGKNIGGTVTVAASALTTTIVDPALTGVGAGLTVSGTDIQLSVVGLAGITIRWSGGGQVARVPLV